MSDVSELVEDPGQLALFGLAQSGQELRVAFGEQLLTRFSVRVALAMSSMA